MRFIHRRTIGMLLGMTLALICFTGCGYGTSFPVPHESNACLNNTIEHITIVMDAQLYPLVKERFTRYLDEVKQRFPVEFSLFKVNGLRSHTPASPTAVRELLKSEHAVNGSVGALLVGQIPNALWKQGEGNNSGVLSVFYEDLDGEFSDQDGDGLYDYHTFGSSEGPEIWVCWMRPPIMGQAFFLNRFLEKTHRYYTGEITIGKKAVVACHEDYDNNFYGPVGVVPVLREIYGVANVQTDGEGTDKTVANEVWRHLRNGPIEVFDTWQHASSTYQAWDSGGFYSLRVLGLLNGPLMTLLYGCHSADFWNAPGTTPFNINLAVSYVFGRSIGQAASGTSWSYGTEYKYMVYESLRDASYLGNAWFVMESYVETASFVEQRYPGRNPHTECAGNSLIGNPFLSVR